MNVCLCECVSGSVPVRVRVYRCLCECVSLYA